MLLPRVLTAAVGSVLFLGAVYFGGLPLFFVVMGLVLLGIREFYFLAQETGYPCYPWVGFASGALVLISVFLNGVALGQVTDNQATSALLGLFLIAIIARSLLQGPADTSLSEWSVTFFGVFYVAWSLSHFVLLRDLRPQGREITFYLIGLIWAADTVAYFVGIWWGRHRIAEKISPKKTWEGTIGGLVGAVMASVLFQTTILRPWLRLPEAIILALIVGLLAFISDLGESILKRGAGVKDSSPLLPGHGGILDRFDSFILTAPFLYYYWAFLKH